MATKKKSSSGSSSTLRNVVTSAAATETIVDLVSRLGLMDLVVGRLKAKIEETDVDELFDEVTDYLRRNPEVLVVGLGAITIATALLVFLNNRREWDGTERRNGDDDGDDYEKPARTTSSTGRVRKSA
ncbi:MAG TPA: hypothetical protein VGD79_01770 [Thermoanaerobaculia bacterium]|jgi:hypothetical protein